MMPTSVRTLSTLTRRTAGYRKHPNLEDVMFRFVILFLNRPKINKVKKTFLAIQFNSISKL